MCGLAGFVQSEARFSDAEAVLRRATDSLVHRGPDDAGLWLDASRRVGLGHRRLSILDLSAEGHQPMSSVSGRFMLVFNGEIYNFGELRRQLEPQEGFKWRGHSDTEVMLAAFEQWGIRSALERFNGMFSFAVWDAERRELTLARDRLGEKPLYYGQVKGLFFFGSELKALTCIPGVDAKIDRNALCMYLRHNYVPAPYSIYQGIRKLPAGHLLTLRLGDTRYELSASEPYWSAADAYAQGQFDAGQTSPEAAGEELHRLLLDAVRMRMVADVPLGAFLSGGIDSSTVVALMQAQSTQPVRTFSIGFNEPAYNEAEHARAVAKHLGTQHTELYVTPTEAQAVIPRLSRIYDEPFADSSQIPTLLVSDLARQYVTVSLSGDGGDELFAGYTRYELTVRVKQMLSRVPSWARQLAAGAIGSMRPAAWNKLATPLEWLMPKGHWLSSPGERLYRVREVLSNRGELEVYRTLVSHWTNPDQVVIGSREPAGMLGNMEATQNVEDVIRLVSLIDLITYLPDDILVKLDRASMAVSLESRVPLLDHRVVEFAARTPTELKVRDRKAKWLLRQVLYRYVPPTLIERPKVGFGVPIGKWLRGPLRDWAEELLSEERLRSEGFFNPEHIRLKWSQHLSGDRQWHYHLWDILMFQAWLSTQNAHG